MSTRLGMADGRCQDWVSNRLFNDAVIKRAKIQETDNYAYRLFLQNRDPDEIFPAQTCSLFKYSDGDIYKDTNVITSENNSRR